jgi:hypothetical protein
LAVATARLSNPFAIARLRALPIAALPNCATRGILSLRSFTGFRRDLGRARPPAAPPTVRELTRRLLTWLRNLRVITGCWLARRRALRWLSLTGGGWKLFRGHPAWRPTPTPPAAAGRRRLAGPALIGRSTWRIAGLRRCPGKRGLFDRALITRSGLADA